MGGERGEGREERGEGRGERGQGTGERRGRKRRYFHTYVGKANAALYVSYHHFALRQVVHG